MTEKTLNYCHTCRQMTNHGVGTNGGCLKCRVNTPTPLHEADETINTDFAFKSTEFGLTGEQTLELYKIARVEQQQKIEEAVREERERIAERIKQGHFSKVADDEVWNNENVKGYKTAIDDIYEALTLPTKEE